MVVPKVIGSFQDLKFRQATAKLLATARRTLFTETEFGNSSAGNPKNILNKEFASSLFKNPGDTVFLTFHGKSTGILFGTGLTITIFDDATGIVGQVLGLYNATPVDLGSNDINFYGFGSLVYLGDNLLRSGGVIFLGDNTGGLAGTIPNLNYDYTSAVFTSKKLRISVDSYQLSGGADVVHFGLMKAEFSPGSGG